MAGEPTARRTALLDIDALGAAAPIMVLVVVGALRKGAFFTPDVVVYPCLCVGLALVSPPVLQWVRSNLRPVTFGSAAVAWWVISAVVWRHGVESWRLAATTLCAACGYGVARSLATATRRLVAAAITGFGVIIATVGLVLVSLRSTTWTWPDERSLRFQGPLTYPSAIGLYLAIALFATTELWPTESAEPSRQNTPKRLLVTAPRSLILLGVIATDSRGSVIALLVMVCFRSVRKSLWPALVVAMVCAPLLLFGQRDGVRPMLIAAAIALAIAASALPISVLRKGLLALTVPALVVIGWLLVTQHHDVAGLDASWTERGHILRGALKVFAAHPWFGAGPDPWIPTQTLNGTPGIDAFAHNEPLELLISLGIIGAVFVAVACVILVRAVWSNRSMPTLPILVTVVAASLVDFVWHFPALGLLTGVVAALHLGSRSAT